ELGRPVEVHGVGRLVRAERDHALDAAVDRRVDDVLRAEDVRLHAFPRVVLGDRNLLEGGGVDHHVHALERAAQAVAITHVAEEEAQRRVLPDDLAHLGLLELVAREDDQPPWAMAREQPLDEAAAERARASRDQHGPIGEEILGHPGPATSNPRPATDARPTGSSPSPPPRNLTLTSTR